MLKVSNSDSNDEIFIMSIFSTTMVVIFVLEYILLGKIYCHWINQDNHSSYLIVTFVSCIASSIKSHIQRLVQLSFNVAFKF